MIRLRSVLAASAVFLLCALPAAASVDSLASGIRSAANTNARNAKGGDDYGAESALVDRLDGLADQFHDLAATGTRMPKTAASLIDLLAKVHGRYAGVIEGIQSEIIRIDGDLEAAQESERWQQYELFSMRVLYRLNWIRYETAMRYESSTDRRRRLLTQAADGFAEFLGSGDAALTTEILLGHGLTLKAQRRYDEARQDFNAALELTEDRDMIVRLRIALAEIALAKKEQSNALTETQRLVSAAPRGESRNQALFLRSKALLLAIGRSPGGSSAGRYRKEAAGHLEELFGKGSYWRAKVTQLADAGVTDPDAWASVSKSNFVSWLIADSLRRRDRCDRAIALYKGIQEDKRFRVPSLYGLGSCAFYEGDYALSESKLGEFEEAAAADDKNLDQSRYLRFKAAESLYVSAPAEETEAAGERYVSRLRTFLEKAPGHDRAYEARFRLGEWHRERSEHRECGDAFAEVTGDNPLALKAGFLSAQCYVEAIVAVDEDQTVPKDLVATAVGALDGFVETVGEKSGAVGADVVKPLEAKAVVMGASVVTRSGFGSMQDRIDRLAGFEDRFGKESAVYPEALALRIVAYRKLSDLDGAGESLEALLELEGAEAYRKDSLKKLGIVFLKEAAERDEAGDPDGALRSRKTALRVYESLLADTKADPGTAGPEAIAGLETLLSGLRADLGLSEGQAAAP